MYKAFLLLILLMASAIAAAQDDYFANWFHCVDKTRAKQPHRITSLATTTPRLEDEFRYDVFWQNNARGVTTDNYGGSKGLELIPTEKLKLRHPPASPADAFTSPIASA
jgi:hypothetical protein